MTVLPTDSPPADPRQALLDSLLRGRAKTAKAVIEPAPRDQPLPLSFSQQGLWVLDQVRPGSAEYLAAHAWDLTGPLDVAALRSALEQVVSRHEVLRTRYVAEGPRQVIDPAGPVSLSEVDLSQVGDPERRLTELTDQQAITPFDLATTAPLRTTLVRLAEDHHVLLFVFHHIAFDGWSIGVLARELGELYTAFAGSTEPTLRPLPVQYADFTVWQRAQRHDTHLDYWRERLADLTPLELPTDRPRRAVLDTRGSTLPFTVPAELGRAVLALGRQHGATPFMVLLAAFEVLLARYSGRTDLAVGTPVAGRTRPEVKDLIGYFVNTVVLRTDLSGNPSFVDLLGRVRETALGAFTHQDLPFDRLVDAVAPDRDLSRNPLFQVMFALQSSDEAAFGGAGMLARRRPTLWQTSKFDLTLHLTEEPDGALSGVLEYATALFDAATMERTRGHFVQLLTQIAADPQAPLSRLDPMTEPERLQVLADWNDTAVAYPAGLSLHELFEQQVRRSPDAVAVVAENAQLSYAELDARANQLAHLLRSRGAGPESIVGVCLHRSLDLVVALLGTLKAGAAYLPLDPDYPADRLGYMLDNSAAALVITTPELAATLPAAEVLFLEGDLVDQPTKQPPVTATPDNPAYVIYTSGSTGRPKGVLVPHRGIVNRIQWMQDRYRLDSTDRVLQKTPYSFDVSVWEFFWPLATGATLVMARPDGHRDPAYLTELIDTAQITTLHFVPTMLRAFLAELEQHASGLMSLRRLICSGEALAPELVTAVHQHLGCELHNLYGPTEASVDVTATVCEPNQPVTIGRPIANTETFVLDADLQPLPVGIPGELCLAGVQLARGYLNQPTLTAERFVPHPFQTGQRLYRTGDLARWCTDGTIEYLGRLDQQVKVRGYRIELGEIETVLAEQPGISAAIVTVHDGQLVAYLHTDTAPSTEELRRNLARSLPEHMIPALFIAVAELPLTSSGKVDRKALPAPDGLRPTLDTGYVAPRTATEQAIATAWASAIGLERVGVHDPFFGLGGDSIMAIRAVGALRAQGFALSVQHIFLHQTVAKLADLVSGSAEASDRLVQPFELLAAADRERLPAGVADAYPLSMVQAGMAHEMLADPDSGRYLNRLCYPIRDDRPLSLDALKIAAQLLVDRHEMLRTSLDLTGYSEPVQLVHATAPIYVGYDDLRHFEPNEQEDTVADFLAQQRFFRFDLAAPSLMRLHVHQLGDTQWRLTVSYCHAVLDGWSQNSLVTELLGYYDAVRAGRDPNPPAPPAVRFADAVALEQQALRSTADREFWATQVGSAERLTIPEAWAGTGAAAFRAVRMPFADLTAPLQALAAQAGVPLKSVLLAAHLTVLGLIAAPGTPARHTGLVCNGRPELADGDQVRGMFLNTVPLVWHTDSDPQNWAELAKTAFAAELALLPHRHFPLPAMQREWGNQTPLVDVFFNYTDMHVLDQGSVDVDGIVDITPNEFGLSVSTMPGVLVLEASTDRIDDTHLDLLARMYRHVLETMAASPETAPRDCRLPTDERHRLLEQWNQTAALVRHRSLPELFEEQVRANSGSIALVTEDTRLSYEDLDRRANQLARHLGSLGVGRGALVGVFLERGADLLISLLAVLKTGAAYVPLDPAYPSERLSYMLADTAATVMITQESLLSRLDDRPAEVVLVDQDWLSIAAQPGERLGHVPDPLDLAYIIYTSGSTGRPKGVMITHAGLTNFLEAMRLRPGLEPGTAMAGLTTVSFDPSVMELYLPLLVGAHVVLSTTEETRDPQRMAALIRASEPAVLQATPVTLRMLIDSGWSAPRGLTILTGGEKLPVELAVRLAADGAQVWDLYGPTETTVWSTTTRLDPAGKALDWAAAANARVHVLDGRLEPVPVGVIGEVYIGGAGVARGYHGRPELTADVFVPDPHSARPGQRLYRTGDLARRHPDGRVEILGRADHQVKIRGHRIEPGEIEAVLLDHEGIRTAVVQPTPTDAGDYQLTAYLVPTGAAAPGTEELRDLLGRTLPDYMVPAAFVVMEALPLTPSGKVDRKALPAPERVTAAQVLPRNDTETAIAKAWAEVLRLDRVGVRDNFFDIGGHSLLATRIAVRLRASLGVAVPVRALFDHTTVAALAAALPGYPPMQRKP